MFNKILSAIVISMISTSVAFGYAPTAKKAASPIEAYTKEVKAETGKSEKEIKEKMIEALRKEGKFTEAELERIGREKVDFDPAKQNAMVSLLRKSSTFRARVGLDAMKSESVSKSAGEAFEKMKESKPAEKAEAKAPAKKPVVDGVAKEEIVLSTITEHLGPKAFEAVTSAKPEHYNTVRRLALILAKRVKSGELGRAEAEGLLVDNANSPRVLDGEFVLGEGAGEACMGMAGEAIKNLAEFVRGGAEVGKDPISYTKGMGEAAAKKFKQDLEEGIARVCALASSGCRLLGNPIVNACKKISAGKAI